MARSPRRDLLSLVHKAKAARRRLLTEARRDERVLREHESRSGLSQEGPGGNRGGLSQQSEDDSHRRGRWGRV